MLPTLLLLLILAALVGVPSVRELAAAGEGEALRGPAVLSAAASSVLAFIAALLAVVAGFASIASPFLGSIATGIQLATVAILIVPPLLEAGLLIVGGLLMRSVRRPSARKRSFLVAGLAGVAIPVAALGAIMAGFAAADFGSGGPPFAAIVISANANAGALVGSVLVLVAALVTAGLVSLRHRA